jgi:hypothetical protein
MEGLVDVVGQEALQGLALGERAVRFHVPAYPSCRAGGAAGPDQAEEPGPEDEGEATARQHRIRPNRER